MSKLKYRINPLGIGLIALVVIALFGYRLYNQKKVVSINQSKVKEFSIQKIQEFAYDEISQNDQKEIKIESYNSFEVQADKDSPFEEIVTIEFVPLNQDEYNLRKYYAVMLLNIDSKDIILRDKVINFSTGWNSINKSMEPHITDLNNDKISEFHLLTSVTGTSAANKTLNVFDLKNGKLSTVWNRDKIEYASFNKNLDSYFIYNYDWQHPEGRLDPHHVFIEQINGQNFKFDLIKKMHSENKYRLKKNNLTEVLANSRQVLIK